MKYILLSIIGLLLVSCGKDAPIRMEQSQKQYIGAWHYFYEKKSSNKLDFQNIVLVIQPDSQANYMKCMVHKNVVFGENHELRSKSSNRTHINLPGAVVTGLTPDNVTLQQKAFIFYFHYHIKISKAPYEQGGHWYLGVDNVLLEKIEPALAGKINRYCPDTDDNDQQDS